LGIRILKSRNGFGAVEQYGQGGPGNWIGVAERWMCRERRCD
jgi:hypothetical protein